jgi:hypothetical protein
MKRNGVVLAEVFVVLHVCDSCQERRAVTVGDLRRAGHHDPNTPEHRKIP